MFDTILDDVEKAKIEAFLNDSVMARAVKKVLLAGVYYNGVLKPGEDPRATRNFALDFEHDGISDENLGQMLRARTEGIRLVEAGFDQLEKAAPKPEAPGKAKPNRAR